MRYKILALLIGVVLTASLQAQPPEKKGLRIVDTLTRQELAGRDPVILRSEADSLIRQWLDAHPQQPVQQPVSENKSDLATFMLVGLIAILFLLGLLVWYFHKHQQRINRTIAGLGKATMETHGKAGVHEITAVSKTTKGKAGSQSLENRINDLNAELHKLSKENEGLNGVIKEYNGIQHDYDSLKHGLSKAYKVKNYPGYDKTKAETSGFQGVLNTEAAVANYAYEKFLKPILAITDANKNNPAKLSAEHSAKLMDLLVSLSLLYIEYLYLRVSDLAIGGKMVERIHGFSNGKGLDPSLLKKLDTEFGSRALVLRMVLDKVQLRSLSYPVFDETNLNP
jgi:hypothetical protein